MNTTITLRPAGPEDDPFLFEVYASTRREELALVPWSESQKADFLRMQFNAQHLHYHTHYADADYAIILFEGESIGRLYVDRGPEEIRLMEITLLPEYRNRGIGTALIKEILAEAGRLHKPVRIHVEPFNPALRLYQRLGFIPLEERGLYLFMEWTRGD